MDLRIVEGEVGYTIMLDGRFFRNCQTYSELATAIGSLVKSRFRSDASGFA